MPIIARTISKVAGLVGEKYHDHKERKAALAEQDKASAASSSRELAPSSQAGAAGTVETIEASDERIWALDEAAGDPPAYDEATGFNGGPSGFDTKHPGSERSISDLVHETMATMPTDAQEQIPERLPYPIIIPQRRPGNKMRGFARAYAPSLEDFDIDQETFMTFLKNFEDASQASPWITAVFIAGGIVGFVPGTITMAVGISVQFAAGTAMELQGRHRANTYLDQINKDLFMPRGLYAMVLLCKDVSDAEKQQQGFGIQDVDLNNAKSVAKWGLPKESEASDFENISKSRAFFRPIRIAQGRIPETQLPLEIAPLVYPGLDDMVERPQVKRDESFKERLMRNKDWVNDYFDRRAQAEYMGNNPNSALSQASSETPQFHTRFGDPNHACNNGNLVSLVTGGKRVPIRYGRRRRNKFREVGPDGRLLPQVKQPHVIRGPVSLITHPIRKILGQNVLYLMIVNLPTDGELEEARQAMEMDPSSFKEMFKHVGEARQRQGLYRRY